MKSFAVARCVSGRWMVETARMLDGWMWLRTNNGRV